MNKIHFQLWGMMSSLGYTSSLWNIQVYIINVQGLKVEVWSHKFCQINLKVNIIQKVPNVTCQSDICHHQIGWKIYFKLTSLKGFYLHLEEKYNMWSRNQVKSTSWYMNHKRIKVERFNVKAIKVLHKSIIFKCLTSLWFIYVTILRYGRVIMWSY